MKKPSAELTKLLQELQIEVREWLLHFLPQMVTWEAAQLAASGEGFELDITVSPEVHCVDLPDESCDPTPHLTFKDCDPSPTVLRACEDLRCEMRGAMMVIVAFRAQAVKETAEREGLIPVSNFWLTIRLLPSHIN